MKQLEIELSKLELTEDSVVVIKYGYGITESQLTDLMETVQQAIGHNNPVLFISKALNISLASSELLNELGWHKLTDHKVH